MTCPACAAENREGARFCDVCGTALGTPCPACGAEPRPGATFCDRCGATLAPAAAASVGTSVPAGGELRVVSVLFVDLVGFTTLSESRDAEEVRELLDRYFETARTIVGRYGGTVEKFIGDAVMAVWGSPLAREDDAERTVRAALDVVDAVAAFGESVGAPGLRARAGVVTGQAAAIASQDVGLVVGDRVNTAARVQSVAEPGTVLVDEATRGVTASAIAYADAGEHLLKGKAEALPLWRAQRVVAGVAGSGRAAVVEAPFVGRDSELRLVKELFHACIDRRTARLVALAGAAGVGKSRLLWEFEKYTDGLAGSVLWHAGRCPSYGEGVAYWALAQMVRQRFAIAEEDAAEEAEPRFAAGLARWLVDPAERAFVAPGLRALLGLGDPGLDRRELFAAWRLFFERLSDVAPVVLVFEDVQWADDGLLDFIEHVLEWSADRPIFILTSGRPELAERREGWAAGRRGATPIYLERLTATDVASLLDGVIEGLPEPARRRIVDQAEGIPLFALETVRALTDRGVVAEREGRLALVGDVGELDVPAGLSSLLAARLDALDTDEREVVKAMAVFGGNFPRAAAAALADVPDDRLDAVLASLVRKEILVIRADALSPDRGQYGFGHGLVRTVAYEMLPRRERRPRHLAAAAHLRRAFPEDGEDVAEVVAAHLLEAYRAAGDDADATTLRAEALAALRRAATRAATVGAPRNAERAYRTARDLADDEAERAALTGLAAEMAQQAGSAESALELVAEATRAHEAAGRPREAARLALVAARALWLRGALEEAIERLRDSLALVGPGRHDPDVAALSAELARLLLFAGRSEESAEPVETALAAAAALGLTEVLADAFATKGVLLILEGRRDESALLLEGAIRIGEEHGYTRVLQRARVNLGHVRMTWDLPGATEACEAALAVGRRAGDPAHEALAGGNLLSVYIQMGRWAEAEELAASLMPGGEDRDRRFGEVRFEDVHARLALLHALRGELDDARRSFAGASAWEHSDEIELRMLYAALAAQLALGGGEPEAALAGAATLVREPRTEEGVRHAWAVLVDAAAALGRFDELGECLDRLAAVPPGFVPPWIANHGRRGRGLMAAAQGDAETAEAELGAALAGMRTLGYPYWTARIAIDLAELRQGRGQDGEARALLAEAIPELEHLRAAPALARARELMAGLDAPVSA